MKKLLALLMACATMTCAFASCGEEKGDGSASTSEESSVSESGADEVESDNADKSEEDETSEEESSEEESEEESEEDSEADEEATESTDDVQKTTYQFLDDVDKSAFIGKWECEKLVVEGEEMTDFMGMPLYAVYQLDIKEDGTAIMGESLNELSDAEVTMVYEWGVISENEIAIINDIGDTMRFEYDGTYIIGTEEGYEEEIYFVKVDEFTPFDFEAFMNGFQEALDDIEIDTDAVVDGESGETDESVSGIDDTDESVDTVDDENVETPEESVAE